MRELLLPLALWLAAVLNLEAGALDCPHRAVSIQRKSQGVRGRGMSKLTPNDISGQHHGLLLLDEPGQEHCGQAQGWISQGYAQPPSSRALELSRPAHA